MSAKPCAQLDTLGLQGDGSAGIVQITGEQVGKGCRRKFYFHNIPLFFVVIYSDAPNSKAAAREGIFVSMIVSPVNLPDGLHRSS